jgi:hypothetical protein
MYLILRNIKNIELVFLPAVAGISSFRIAERECVLITGTLFE